MWTKPKRQLSTPLQRAIQRGGCSPLDCAPCGPASGIGRVLAVPALATTTSVPGGALPVVEDAKRSRSSGVPSHLHGLSDHEPLAWMRALVRSERPTTLWTQSLPHTSRAHLQLNINITTRHVTHPLTNVCRLVTTLVRHTNFDFCREQVCAHSHNASDQ